MVIYKVITTKNARNCIKSIYDYLEENTSKQTAQKVYGGLFDEISSLSQHPHKNSIIREISNNRNYRRKL